MGVVVSCGLQEAHTDCVTKNISGSGGGGGADGNTGGSNGHTSSGDHRPTTTTGGTKARLGLWTYERYLELDLNAMPLDADQIPDIIVHLYDTTLHKRVSFCR
jgi:hypothetical protein